MGLAVLTPVYCPSIYYMAWLIRHDKVLFDISGNYQKQTYRNRTSIYGANGKLNLSIPITHSKKEERQKDKEVRIFSDVDWQKQHWKSITSAYRSSPYFEYYEDDFEPLFHQKHEFLMPLNIALVNTLISSLGITVETAVLEDGSEELSTTNRALLSKKTPFPQLPEYTQVFGSKHGFISNLSCIDLLFNLGPESLDYLTNITHKV